MYESVITEVPAEEPGGKPVPAPGPLEMFEGSMTVFSDDLYVSERLVGEGIAGNLARTDQFAPSVSKLGEYEFVSQLPPQPEPGQSRFGGIAFGTTASETEMYIGQTAFAGAPGVNVFAAGVCGILECASFQTLWTGAGAPSPFEGVGHVVVDHSTSLGDWASGDVLVDAGVGVIDIFEPQAGGEEKYVGQVTGFSGAIAVSGFNGDLVVGDKVFHPEEEGPKKGKYGFACRLVPPSGPLIEVKAVAVDDGKVGSFAGEIYVATSSAVYEFGPECGFRGDITGVPREGVPTGVKGQTEEVRFNENTTRPTSIAVDPVSHRVFVGVTAQNAGPREYPVGVVDVFGPDVVVPDVVTEAPSNLVLETNSETGAESWGIKPTGSVNPDEAGEATCWFRVGVSEVFGQETPCSAPVHDGGSLVRVHGSLTGLEPDTSYVYRLQARNSQGTNQGEALEDYRFTTPGPGLRSESVSRVSSSSVTFEGTVAPHDAPNYASKLEGGERAQDFQAPAKSPTSYYFQYSTQSMSVCVAEASACTSVPFSPVSVGSGATDVHVSQHVQGLTGATTYHYRLVAVNEALPASKPGVLSAFYGPDRTFTTQGAGEPLVLPDGRAWELVSPVDKHGAKIEPSGQAAVGGGGFTFVADRPTESEPMGYVGFADIVQVLSSRKAPGEWSSVDIALSHRTPVGVLSGIPPEYRFFSEDLGLSVAESMGPFSVPEGWHKNAHGEWERVVEASPLPAERTPYLRHDSTCESVPASCYEPLLNSEDVTSGQKYEGNGNQGLVNFLGATPDAAHIFIGSSVQLTSTEAPEGGVYEWSADRPVAQRLSLVNVLADGKPGPGGLMALSADGSRVFFGGCIGNSRCHEFYLHDVVRGETVRLDVTEGGSPPQAGLGGLAGASADGSRAFFTYDTKLTKDAGLKGSDLYVCEIGLDGSGALQCVLKDLTSVPASGQPGAGENAEVSRVLGVSRDGSYVYFLAKGVLAAGASPGENLYVAHEQEGIWNTSFIASPSSVGQTSVVSDDGRWFAFSSERSLTGYDNRDAKTDTPDSEVYLYNAALGKLVCASCNPSGARPVGPAEVPLLENECGLGLCSVQLGSGGSRSLFDDGRLFFNSGDALVPQDTNDNVDVYEFEPADVGRCMSASVTFNAGMGGCVGLISSGVALGESVFLDASSTGADVFFRTGERLVGRDVDAAVDVYDAHECTSTAPCAPPQSPPRSACQSAASCRLAPLTQPSLYGAPSSAMFSGAGNVVPGAHKEKPTPEEVREKKLRKALRECRRKRAKSKRVACERKMRARYSRVGSSKVSAKRSVVTSAHGKRG